MDEIIVQTIVINNKQLLQIIEIKVYVRIGVISNIASSSRSQWSPAVIYHLRLLAGHFICSQCSVSVRESCCPFHKIVMEISSQNLGNLLLLNDVTIEKLRAMCKYFLQALITGTSSALDSNDLERELSALSTFLLEAAKQQSTVKALRLATFMSKDSVT